MPIRDDDVLVDHPAGADVIRRGEPSDIQTADGACGAIERSARRLEPRSPHGALAVGEPQLRTAADHGKDRPADAEHDIAERAVERPPRERSRAAKAANLVGQHAIDRVESGDERLDPRVYVFHEEGLPRIALI